MNGKKVLGILGLIVCVGMMLLGPELWSSRASVDFSNKAIAELRDKGVAVNDPTAPEVRAIGKQSAEVTARAFREAFNFLSLIVSPMAAFLSWALLTRVGSALALFSFALVHGVILAFGLAGIYASAWMVACFAIALLVPYRSRTEAPER